MKLVLDIELALHREKTFRMQGLRTTPSAADQTFHHLAQELLELTSKLSLLQPALVYDIYPIVRIEQDRINVEDGRFLEGALPAEKLRNAKEVAVAVCTIGPRLERHVKRSFDEGRRVQATLLDGIGSSAVEELAQKACQIIQDEASARGLGAGTPLAPGIPDFPLSQQDPVCQMAGAHNIGVHLTEAGMLKPRKSTAMVVGLGKEMPRATRGKLCNDCNLNSACRFRVEI